MIIISVVAFILFPILSLPIQVAGIIFDIKNKRIYGCIISIIIGIIGMNIVPNENMDLYRYYEMMNSIRDYNTELIVQKLILTSEPLMNIIFYTIAKMGMNELIVLFTSVVYYNLFFYMFFDYCEECKISNNVKGILLIVSMISIMIVPTITGIRFALGTIIFVLAIYLEYIKNQKSWWYKLLYVISGVIHASMFAMIIIRLCMIVTKDKVSNRIIILLLLICLFPVVLEPVLKMVSNISFLSALITRLGYLNMKIQKTNLEFLNIVTNLSMSIIIIKMYLKNKSNKILQLAIYFAIPGIIFMGVETVSARIFCIVNLLFIFSLIYKYKDYKEFVVDIAMIIYLLLLLVRIRTQFLMFKNAGGLDVFFQNEYYKNIIYLIMKGNKYV